MGTTYKTIVGYIAWGLFYVAAILVILAMLTAVESPWNFIVAALWALFVWNFVPISRWLWRSLIVRWQAKLIALMLIVGTGIGFWYVGQKEQIKQIDFYEEMREDAKRQREMEQAAHWPDKPTEQERIEAQQRQREMEQAARREQEKA